MCPECGAKYRDDVRVCEVDGVPLLPDKVVEHLDDDLQPGDEVGEYQIDAKIGQGAFGAVYSATHLLIGKRAAIKVLASRHSTDAQTVSRFLSEARAVNQIRHKYIVDIFSFGSLDDGRQYFIMELLEGTTLREYFTDKGGLTAAEALPILRRIARALDAAHDAGIAHRDLKPDNVFVVFDEDGVFPKLLDFGVAKLLDDKPTLHSTGAGTPMGTPMYMSPEQWRGKNIDHRSDIFSLGVMAFELLAGSPPYSGESPMDLMVKVATEDPPDLSSVDDEVSQDVDDAIRHMLARSPEDRPPSASAAIAALAEAFGARSRDTMVTADGESGSSLRAHPVDEATEQGVSQTLDERRTQSRPLVIAAIVAAAAIVVFAIRSSLREPPASPAATTPSARPIASPEPSSTTTSTPAPKPSVAPSASANPSSSASANPSSSTSAMMSARPAAPPRRRRPPTSVAPTPTVNPTTKTRPIIPVEER